MKNPKKKILKAMNAYAEQEIISIISSQDFEMYIPVGGTASGDFMVVANIEMRKFQNYIPIKKPINLFRALNQSMLIHDEKGELESFIQRWEKLKTSIDKKLEEITKNQS